MSLEQGESRFFLCPRERPTRMTGEQWYKYGIYGVILSPVPLTQEPEPCRELIDAGVIISDGQMVFTEYKRLTSRGARVEVRHGVAGDVLAYHMNHEHWKKIKGVK